MKLSDRIPEISYQLSLSNGQNWDFFSDADTQEWTQRFASVLALAFGHPREASFVMTFCRTLADTFKDQRGEFIEVPADQSLTQEVLLMWKAILPIYRQAMTTGGIPIHAALIEHNGRGILLAAPGGTGKTTCCWRLPADWTALCDDETLLLPGMVSGHYQAHPFPTWSNFYLNRTPLSWNVAHAIPVKAILFLQQANTDRVRPVGQGQATALVYQASAQICRRIWAKLEESERIPMQKSLFEFAGNVALNLPAFMLDVSLNGRFWELIEMVLAKGSSEGANDAFNNSTG